MNIADLDFLTPGSIFVREDGRESRFLCLTNTALPEKARKKYPSQVVYADENNHILSCDIDRFLNKRKFHMVDPDLESRLENLLALSNSDGEDSLDLDSDETLLTIDDSEDEGDAGDDDGSSESEDAPEVQEDDFITQEDSTTPLVRFIPSNDMPAALDAEYLAQAVSSYQQSPGAVRHSVQHALFIRAESGITRDSLIATFSPAAEQQGTSSIYTFEVDLEDSKVHVNWDEFLGVYPCVFYGSSMYQVLFHTLTSVAPQQPIAEPTALDAVEAEADAELAEMEASNLPTTVAFTEVDEAPIAPSVQVEVSVQ